MQFQTFNQLLQKNLDLLLADVDRVFIADVNKDTLWNLYLDSFPEGTNKIFRERREYDCSCCRQFIKELGALVVIKGGKKHTIWGFHEVADLDHFAPVAEALDTYVKSLPIANVYLAIQQAVGTAKSYEDTRVWEHFHYVLPPKVCFNGRKQHTTTVGTLLGDLRTTREVFQRSLEEVSEDSILTVLELTAQGSLYKGDEWVEPLNAFLKLQRQYQTLDANAKELFLWTADPGPALARIKNHSIGVLLQDISKGVDLDEAVRRYETIVAPTNYKRPKAIFTQKMLEAAQATVTELGLLDSLPRRFAILDDISVADTLFVDRSAVSRLSKGVFEELSTETRTIDPKAFSKAEEVPLERFLRDVLPGTSGLEVLLESRHAGNLVSLIAPQNKEAPSLFRWPSGFSWAYSGNITDSQLKSRVKAAGGAVDGVLRFSIQWNDEPGRYNGCDYDAHCLRTSNPDASHIFFGNKLDPITGGKLDIDIRLPTPGTPAVENITWPERDRLRDGTYEFRVHNYRDNGGSTGFAAEIEFDGEIHQYEVRRTIRGSEQVPVAKVSYSKKEGFHLVESIEGTTKNRTLWGLKTGQFHKVLIALPSPNYWDGSNLQGNKHLFLMLADCTSDETPNGFFNEFLRTDLDGHKRVFEALGTRMRVKASNEQLSGLGFSSTKRDTLVCRVKGKTSRIVKVLL